MEDTLILIYHFLDKWFGKAKAPDIPDPIMLRMMDYIWPGNVRELENVLSRYITFGRLEFTGSHMSGQQNDHMALDNTFLQKNEDLADVLDRVEKQIIRDALNKHSWRMTETSRELGGQYPHTATKAEKARPEVGGSHPRKPPATIKPGRKAGPSVWRYYVKSMSSCFQGTTSTACFITTEHTEHTEVFFRTIFFRVFRVVRGSMSSFLVPIDKPLSMMKL